MDSEDDLKRQARRRLIGAVALVTAVVVILPMVLDREPRPAGQDIVLSIPNKDAVGEFTSQMVLPESAPVAASEPVAASVPAAASASAVPAATAAHPEKAQISPEKKPEPARKPEPRVESQKHPAPTHAAPAVKHESKPAEKAQAVPKGGFVVQVDAFANADTAKSWRDKLSKQGWHAYTEKAGNKVRVRVGAYPTRAAAEKVLHKLAAQGTQPVVVDLN